MVTYHSIKGTVASLPVAEPLLVSFAAVLWDVAQRSPLRRLGNYVIATKPFHHMATAMYIYWNKTK